MEYIYESPDGGKTIYRHPLGFPDKKELITGREPELFVSDDGTVTIATGRCDGCNYADKGCTPCCRW